MDDALRERPQVFGLELRRLLSQDRAAQAKSAYITGIDFDPFLGTQGKFKSLVLGTAAIKGNRCFVGVYLTFNAPQTGPQATAEVAFGGRKWEITNYRYPRPVDADLLSLLKNMARQR